MPIMDLYKTNEWKSLDEIDRAQLLLVIEGLKRGTIIRGNRSSFLRILNYTGLNYRIEGTEQLIFPVMRVSFPNILSDFKQKLRNGEEYHRTNEWFLGYPECCVDRYIESRRTSVDTTGQFLTELHERRRSGNLPPQTKYKHSGFLPCRIDCTESLDKFEQYGEALERLDPEAASEVVYWNTTGLHRPLPTALYRTAKRTLKRYLPQL